MDLKHFLSGVCMTCLLALPAIAAEPLQSRGEISVKGGTDRSLLTTEFWTPIAQESDRVLYGDIRLMGDNDENREGNLGIGYRQIKGNAVLGGHAWIDRRRTQNNSTFHQMTFGVERLGHSVDVRANLYVPLNESRNITTPNIGQTSPYLAGSGIFYDTNGLITETPQYGVDGELGYRLPVLQKHADAIRIYGGGYHFFRNDTENVTGFRIRTEAQINKIISIGARFQHDEPRGSQGFLEATLKFPFSAKKLYQTDSLRSRLDESPERDVDIVTDAKVDSGLMKPMINTSSGTMQRVLYVDNTNTASGDGTKENPFNTLAAAQAALQANDILYINRGDGTTTGMDQGIVIDKANVSLIGSGSNFVFDSGKFTAANGENFSGTLLKAAGFAPVITNTQAFVDDNYGGTVSYLSYTGNGVFVTGSNIAISGITVSNVTASGIYVLKENSGNNSDFVTVSNVTVTGSQNGRGIIVSARNGAMIDTVNIGNSVSNGNLGVHGKGVELRSQTAGSRINNILLQNNNTHSNAVHGIQTYSDQAFFGTATLTGNNSTGNGSAGIIIQTSGASRMDNAIISNNTTSNNTSFGIRFTVNQDSTLLNARVSDNIVNGNTSHGIYATTASTNSRLENLDITGNTVMNGLSGGVRVELNGGMLTNTLLANNIITGNTGSGIYLPAGASSTVGAVTISGNTSNNNQYGLFLYASNATASINNVKVSGNNFMNNTANGIYLLKSAAAAVFNVDLGSGGTGSAGQNRVFGNTGTDLRLNYTGGGSVTARNNWWGNAAGLQPGRVTLSASTTVDSTAFLTTDPRP